MRCPFCLTDDTIVKDSRESDSKQAIRRRRLCVKCKKRFTTFEKVAQQELAVIKRSGIKRSFDRDKIYKSINTAVRKRNISPDKVQDVVDEIVAEIENSGLKEIPSRKIGGLIMQKLAQIDQVAYIRFASVYKDFTNVQDFVKFINKI